MTSLDRPPQDPTFSHREERRPVALAGWLVRAGRDDAHDFLITDMSYGGCRLETKAPLARGDRVQLNVLRRGAIPATVCWHNGHGVGLAFSTEAPAKREKPRKVDRLPLNSELLVRRAGRHAQLLDVSDLSRFGCCLHFNDPPTVGDWIWVTLPGLAPLEARIRWVDERRAGVEFVHPVHHAVFDLLLLRCGLTA